MIIVTLCFCAGIAAVVIAAYLIIALMSLIADKVLTHSRKPKCVNNHNCGDCVHCDFIFDEETGKFKGIQCDLEVD